MLLYFTHKSHTSPPLRYVPVIICKGRDKLGDMQIKCDFSTILWLKNLGGYKNLLVLGMFLSETSLIICRFHVK